MKKVFLFLFIFSLSQSVFATPKKDTTGTPQQTPQVTKPDKPAAVVPPKPVSDTFKLLVDKIDALGKSINSLKDTTTKKNCSCVAYPKPASVDGWEWLLIFTPLIVFLVIFFKIGIPKDFKLNDALTENEQSKKTIINEKYEKADLVLLKDIPNLPVMLPPTLDVSSDNAIFRPSISRYIAYIASILTLMIALCMSCFFIYNYIVTGCPPDLSALSTILIALGIGVAPYAFNKVSGAIGTNKS